MGAAAGGDPSGTDTGSGTPLPDRVGETDGVDEGFPGNATTPEPSSPDPGPHITRTAARAATVPPAVTAHRSRRRRSGPAANAAAPADASEAVVQPDPPARAEPAEPVLGKGTGVDAGAERPIAGPGEAAAVPAVAATHARATSTARPPIARPSLTSSCRMPPTTGEPIPVLNERAVAGT
ncbi:hypothetical protein ACFQ0M_06720 [Kitasatospora aburaviensis]